MSTQIASEAQSDTITSDPPLFACVLHNDDYTSMEFVIEVLMRFFKKNKRESETIMWKVHTEGHAVCGIFDLEIAETKAAQVIKYARSHDAPLLCTVEPVLIES